MSEDESEHLVAAKQLKATGNDFFKQKLYAPAASSYTDALIALGPHPDGTGVESDANDAL